MIEMGKGLQIGKQYQKKLQIESNCPVNFEYMIDVTKPHPDITISPLVGDILGLQTTSIDFIFTPKSYSTAEAEIEIRTTEFDSQPKTIRIMGSAAPKQGVGLTGKTRDPLMTAHSQNKFEPGQTNNLNVIYEEDQQASLSRLQQPKTLLQDRSLRNGPVRLQKIAGRPPPNQASSSIGGNSMA